MNCKNISCQYFNTQKFITGKTKIQIVYPIFFEEQSVLMRCSNDTSCLGGFFKKYPNGCPVYIRVFYNNFFLIEIIFLTYCSNNPAILMTNTHHVVANQKADPIKLQYFIWKKIKPICTKSVEFTSTNNEFYKFHPGVNHAPYFGRPLKANLTLHDDLMQS